MPVILDGLSAKIMASTDAAADGVRVSVRLESLPSR